MSDERTWREVLAQEALSWCVGKTIAKGFGDRFDTDYITVFTDGSALKVEWERGTVYSEHTEDSDEVHFYLSDPS